MPFWVAARQPGALEAEKVHASLACLGEPSRPVTGRSGTASATANTLTYVLRAEELGFHSVFVVEHHFTGVGQLSASLNF